MGIHILVVSHAWYGDVTGGAFRLASEFAEHLAEAGHRVSFVCCARSCDASDAAVETIRGVNVYRYWPERKRRNGLSRMRFHVRQTKALVQMILATDAIDIVSGHSPLQMLGALRAAGTAAASTYTVHSPFDDEQASNSGGGLISWLAARVARWVDGRIVAACDRLQTDSAYTLRSMIQKHGVPAMAKGLVAPGWVEGRQFHPAENRFELRRSLGDAWQADLPIFFTLRRLENRMGLETLVAASARLKQQGLQFRTLIGGGGPLRGALEQQIRDSDVQDRVFLLGRLPEEQLAKSYAAADCFVLPTKALECFGLIVLEAFACNTPVIASNVAAIPELAERQGKEWMFEPGNADELADRMRDVITGRLRTAIDLRSVAMEYDKPKILKRWEELLLESKRPLTSDS